MAKNFIKSDNYRADNVHYRHYSFLKFIRKNIAGLKILDIRSSHARLLSEINAEFKVAFDISNIYLERIPILDNIVRIQGDAERLPLKKGFLDVIIIADILEHLINPKNLIDRLEEICMSSTKIFVHIPWENNLEQYIQGQYEFSHPCIFYSYSYCILRHRFKIKRSKYSFPDLRYPLIFALENRMPLWILNLLFWYYLNTKGISKREWKYIFNIGKYIFLLIKSFLEKTSTSLSIFWQKQYLKA